MTLVCSFHVAAAPGPDPGIMPAIPTWNGSASHMIGITGTEHSGQPPFQLPGHDRHDSAEHAEAHAL